MALKYWKRKQPRLSAAHNLNNKIAIGALIHVKECCDCTGCVVGSGASRNSLMRPGAEPDNAEIKRREDSDIHHCINHVSLHQKQIAS
jgi:hypothetical protein